MAGTFTVWDSSGNAFAVSAAPDPVPGSFTVWDSAGNAFTVAAGFGVTGSFTAWDTSGNAYTIEEAFGEEILPGETVKMTVRLSMVGPDHGSPEFPIRLEMQEYGAPEFDITLNVFDPSFVDANPLRWQPKVVFDGVDVTDDCLGPVEVEAEEGMARIARFSRLAEAGPLDLTSWVGKPVAIEFQQVDANQVPLVSVRLFTGLVDIPEYDPTNNVVTFSCIDNLNGLVGLHSRAALDNLIGGWWSPFVFDPDSNSLEYAEQQLSTVPRSLDSDAFGVMRVTEWAAKATPDFTFDEDTKIIDGTIRFEFANRSAVKNVAELEYQYRFTRLRSRRSGCAWQMPPLSSIIGFDFSIPTKSMVEGAANGLGGWTPLVIGYVEPPVTQAVGPFAWICQPIVAAQLAWGASLAIARRWTQTITEVYPLRVISESSIAALGEIKYEETIGMEVPAEVFDFAGWENDLQRTPGPTYPPIAPSVPPYPRAGASDPGGAGSFDMSAHGADFFQDVTDVVGYARSDQNYGLQTLLNKAKTAILGSHRTTRVLFTAPLNPFLDVVHTAYVDHENLQAQGKVASITWKMDAEGGAAVMEVAIAISGTGAGGFDEEDPLEAPPTPPTPVYTPPAPVGGGTMFGSQSTSTFPQPDKDNFKVGYLGNQTNESGLFDSTRPYIEEFRFVAPEIEDELTQPLDLDQSEVIFRVNVPEDLLALNP